MKNLYFTSLVALLLFPLCMFVPGNEAGSFFSYLYNLTDFDQGGTRVTPFLRLVYSNHTAWEVLETSAKLQKEWDLSRNVAINADPFIDTILACVRQVSTPLGTTANLSMYLYKSKELDQGAHGGPDGHDGGSFRMIAMVG